MEVGRYTSGKRRLTTLRPTEERVVSLVMSKGYAVNKNDLVASVAQLSSISKADAANAVDAVFDSIKNALGEGDEVRLVGFGTFSVVDRKASTGRNPQTGEVIQVPASRQPKFKPGKPLKEAVR